MANQFIARNGIISRGDVTISGSFISTAPATFSGSLAVEGNIYLTGSQMIRTVTTASSSIGSTLTLKGGDATTGSYTYGGSVVIAGGDAIDPAGVGGSVYLYGGVPKGSQSGGSVNLGTNGNNYPVYLRGTPQFVWDGPSATYATKFLRGGSTRFSIYDDVNLTTNYYFRGGATTINAIWDNWKTVMVRGSGTTSATTALLVQNANTSASLQVRDDGSVLAKSIAVPDTSGNYLTALTAYDNNEIKLTTTRWVSGGCELTNLGNGLGIDTGNYGVIYGGLGIRLYNNNTSMQPGRFGTRIQYFGNSSLLSNSYTYALKAEANINITDGTLETGSIYGILIDPVLGTLNNTKYVALRSTTGSVEITGSLNVTLAADINLATSGSSALIHTTNGERAGIFRRTEVSQSAGVNYNIDWDANGYTIPQFSYSSGVFTNTSSKTRTFVFSMQVAVQAVSTGFGEVDIWFSQGGTYSGTNRYGQVAYAGAASSGQILSTSWTFTLTPSDTVRCYVWADQAYRIGHAAFGNNANYSCKLQVSEII